jgi:hypothetical protein
MRTHTNIPSHLKLANAIKAFNPTLSEKQVAEKVKLRNVKFEITDVTPAGYGN